MPRPQSPDAAPETTSSASRRAIHLEGVRVHNLKDITLDIPLHQLVVVSGVSGSGKSSLAFNTLYAEGQRRYIESFSPYARQFLDRMERPDADLIDNLPPALAVRQSSVGLSAKSTVATATEIHDYLRLLFARVGRILCPDCQVEVRRETPETVLAWIRALPQGTRFIVAFPTATDGDFARLEQLREEGFTRVISGERIVGLTDSAEALTTIPAEIHVVVDRLTIGRADEGRILDSLELAFRQGGERCLILADTVGPGPQPVPSATIEGGQWHLQLFRADLVCPGCGRQFVEPDPRLFSFNNPLGACPTCEGFGAVPAISFEKVVPDPSKSLRDGAVAPWTTPAYRHELDELLALAPDYGIPVDVPFSELSDEHRRLIMDGVPERRFGGLKGFFRWLERHKYKLSARIFLNRWRSYDTCPVCHGDRLRPEALAVRLIPDEGAAGAGGRCARSPGGADNGPRATDSPNIAELTRWDLRRSSQFLRQLPDALSDTQRDATRTLFRELFARIGYLAEVGLDYLTLDRPVRTLSGGEAQRVALTATLGSSLVNTLYVLDEPSAGLHPRDNERVIASVRRLRETGNTVVVVEHDPAFIRAAEFVVDIGPGAGQDGGRVVCLGVPDDLARCEKSVTGAYLFGRLAIPTPAQRRLPQAGWLTLRGARQHNLKNLTVRFPLGVLCVVTGVSGSGKSTLVEDTLYPALCRALKQSCAREIPGECDGLDGIEQIDEVILADQTPIGRTSRSNPVTYIGAFDEIRRIFAATPEAKVRNYTVAQFSFNSASGGRCPHCLGSGTVEIDMQFLSDVVITCPECHGTRYRREVLEVKYRDRSIADVLAMTVREAFAFFRTHRKLQRQLQFLKEVGVEYLPLGQPATTLSGGESQRLKLASFLASGTRSRTLFLIDEPTVGLHTADVARLLQCFDSLLAVGHSLIVVEHDLDVIRSADYVIDLGPEAGDAGGEVVADGTPEDVARCDRSITGKFLKAAGVLPPQ